MTTMTARTFPLDDLLTCGNCQGKFTLETDPQPRYVCGNSCSTGFRADELNRLVIPEVTAVVVTDATFPTLKARFVHAMTETTDQDQDAQPSDAEIRRLVTDPETFLADDAVPAAAELLGTFIERVELEPTRAVIQYAMALPSGSSSAGSRRQEIPIPGSMTE